MRQVTLVTEEFFLNNEKHEKTWGGLASTT